MYWYYNWKTPPCYDCEKLTKGGVFTVGQTWEALRKCWRGYNIAKNDRDYDNMKKYAMRIRKLQWELDEPRAHFRILE